MLPYFEFVIWMWSLPLVHQGLPSSFCAARAAPSSSGLLNFHSRACSDGGQNPRSRTRSRSVFLMVRRAYVLIVPSFLRFRVLYRTPENRWRGLASRLRSPLNVLCYLFLCHFLWEIGLDKCPPSVDQVCGL